MTDMQEATLTATDERLQGRHGFLNKKAVTSMLTAVEYRELLLIEAELTKRGLA